MIRLKNILLEKITKTLRIGSRGEQVKELQQLLIAAGYLDAKQQSGRPADDGIFGSATDAAVKKWQRKVNLDDDGIVGPDTRNKLSTIENPTGANTTTTQPPASNTVPGQTARASGGLAKKRSGGLARKRQMAGNNLKQITKNEIPFSNREQGNHFRIFVNSEYPAIAKKLDLTSTGRHDNTTILNALNTIVDGKTLLIKYNEYKAVPKNWESLVTRYMQLYKTGEKKTGANTWSADELSDEEMKKAIERYNIPTNSNSKRISDQLTYIAMRNANQGLGFFLVDPRLNLVFVFNKDYKLVNYSQTVASADPQKSVIFTRDDWMRLSGFQVDPQKEINSGRYYKEINGQPYIYRGQGVAATADGVKVVSKTINNMMHANYDVLVAAKDRYQAAGIYTIGSIFYEAGYTQQQDADGKNIKRDNVYGLKTLDDQSLGTWIHSLASSPARIEADTELAGMLKKDLKNGTIPDEYIDAVEWAMGSTKYDKSSGCFNVSPEFIQDPAVAAVIVKGKSRVFIMSEQPEDYLVRVDQGKEGEYFNKLNGDDGNCVNPNSLTDTYGDYLV
jgi:peptidoglycan hydrolase-like protein with peptidoglycan-binding domain